MASINKLDRIRIWDLPLRLFHWLLAAAFAMAWLARGDRYLDLHVFAGYLVLGLLSFRVAWGVVGGRYARFSAFAYGWCELRSYLTRFVSPAPLHYAGHNPAGSWAIYLMLALLAWIAVSGLLVLGGEEQHGPLAGWLSREQGAWFHAAHAWSAWLMLAVVGLHLAGVAVESHRHRESLVGGMLHGHKRCATAHAGSRNHRGVGMVLLITLLVAALVYFRGYFSATADRPYLPFVGPVLADNALWRQECGSCHLAYHPSLLPARSWQTMLASQHDHFGDDLALTPDSVRAISGFLVAHAAETGATEAAWKINRSLNMSTVPLRITETPYWQKKHEAIAKEVWRSPRVSGQGDCAACHRDAEQGTYEDGAMRLPAESVPSNVIRTEDK